MNLDNYISCPADLTLYNSWVSTVLLSPCSYAVNRLALKTEGECASRGVQLLQYVAKPIDSVIQAIAMIIFTFYDHFRDISYDIKSCNIGTIIAKSLLTPINLPLKMLGASIMSVGFLSGGIFQLAIPYQTIYSVVKGKQAAHLYFYENESWRLRFNDNSLRMKPMAILKSFDIDDSNPFWLQRKALLEKIDGPLRNRICDDLDISNGYPEYKELLKNKCNNEKFIINNVLAQDEQVKASLSQAKESLNKLEEINKKIQIARIKWAEIDRISDQDLVINDGIPWVYSAQLELSGARVKW
jgi:hypothetical protein